MAFSASMTCGAGTTCGTSSIIIPVTRIRKHCPRPQVQQKPKSETRAAVQRERIINLGHSNSSDTGIKVIGAPLDEPDFGELGMRLSWLLKKSLHAWLCINYSANFKMFACGAQNLPNLGMHLPNCDFGNLHKEDALIGRCVDYLIPCSETQHDELQYLFK